MIQLHAKSPCCWLDLVGERDYQPHTQFLGQLVTYANKVDVLEMHKGAPGGIGD